MRNDLSFPCLEQPIRCFLLSEDSGKSLSCNSDGVISSSPNRLGWEEWFILEESDGTIRIKSRAHGKYLAATQYGDVLTHEEEQSHGPDVTWRIQKDDAGHYTLQSVLTDEYLWCSYNQISTTPKEDQECSLWSIAFLNGELCFISMPKSDKRMTCDHNGKLGLSANWKGWEVWRFIEAGNSHVRITSWTHSTKVLRSFSHGGVSSCEDLLDDSTLWSIERAPNGYFGVAIKSVLHNRFLYVDNDEIRTSKRFDGEMSTWQLSSGHRQCYFISSNRHDVRIASSSDELWTTKNRKDWEVWCLDKQDNGVVALKSHAHKKYLSYSKAKGLHLVDNVEEDGLWKLDYSTCKGKLCFVSETFGVVLSCDGNGNISTKDYDTTDENVYWNLEPCMPHTITGKQIKHRMIGGALAAASIIAAPVAVMGLVSAIGFGAEGIAAGSVAAGMMSAEAIAAGGGVVAGGTVATLQSIGATGLGLAGTSACMGAGGVVGASAFGVAVATSKEKNETQQGTKATDATQNRPFCDWKRW